MNLCHPEQKSAATDALEGPAVRDFDLCIEPQLHHLARAPL